MSRLLAIGDIHGCFDALQTLVDFVDFRCDDILVTLGDYVDRGSKTRQVNGHAICIDTGACKNGWLTCLDVSNAAAWQANEEGQTRRFMLNKTPPAT
jgi:predicted phosphodiesterase